MYGSTKIKEPENKCTQRRANYRIKFDILTFWQSENKCYVKLRQWCDVIMEPFRDTDQLHGEKAQKSEMSFTENEKHDGWQLSFTHETMLAWAWEMCVVHSPNGMQHFYGTCREQMKRTAY